MLPLLPHKTQHYSLTHLLQYAEKVVHLGENNEVQKQLFKIKNKLEEESLFALLDYTSYYNVMKKYIRLSGSNKGEVANIYNCLRIMAYLPRGVSSTGTDNSVTISSTNKRKKYKLNMTYCKDQNHVVGANTVFRGLRVDRSCSEIII